MIENANDFEIFLKNSQNTFINRLCIKIMIREGDDILLYIKEYIMKKKRVKHLSFKVNNNDLFFLKDEVKEFELYNIKVQSFYYFSSESDGRTYDFEVGDHDIHPADTNMLAKWKLLDFI
ncbi:hypothetical protein RhiirA5_423856 [Rhizophagus irregularis]|nr:hypothetical protein RhiirA5_423856 [Rhizophagus irregularis]